MGEIEIAGKDALAAVQRITSQRRVEAEDRTDPVLRPDDRRRHVRRRLARLPDGGPAFPAGRQRLEHPRRTSRGFAEHDRRRRRRGRGQLQQPLRADRDAGAAARDVLQTADRRGPGGIKYYWFATRRGRRRPRRRSRGRAIRAKTASRSSWRPPCAERVWDALLEAGEAVDAHPVRARRARHAAPRSGDAPLRQRHRRHDDRARSRPRVDPFVDKGDFIGRDALRAQKAAGLPRSWSALR